MTTLTETASDVQALIDTTVAGYVPTSRTVAGKALSSNVTLVASDVGAPSGSGTVSGTNTGDQTAIANATLATMAQKTYKGRTTTSTGVPEDVPVATLKTDLGLVKADVGLGNVDNTADASKPVSTAQQTALDLKANLSGPTLVAPVLGTPASGVMTNVTGTAANLTAGNVSTVPTTNSKTLRLDGTYGVAYAKYSFGTDGGAVSTITPGGTVNTTIPANAILVGGVVNVTTQCLSSGSATVAIGCAGTGGSTTTLLAATAKASLTANAVLATVTTFAAPKKLTGAGGITFTIGTATLTQGVIEVWVTYFTAAA